MKKFLTLAVLASSLFISSCDNEMKKSLGIVRNTPNEYAVMKHPPLSVPPSFELTPPSEKPQPRKVDTEVKFTKKKTSEKKPADKKEKPQGMTNADKKFSSKFAKYKKRSDIRDVISKEQVEEEKLQKEIQSKKKKSALEVIKGWF